jgi:hypothetical protein
MRETPAVLPPAEPCAPTPSSGLIDPPAWACDPSNEMRLTAQLRNVARTRDPYIILARAAAAFIRGQNPAPGVNPTADLQLANALADLAVTGRRAYCLMATPPHNPTDQARLVGAGDHVDLHTAPFTQSQLHLKILGHLAQLVPPPLSTAQATRAIDTALDRAFATAWALRGPVAVRGPARRALGWLAVSAEDDMPHRPTNVPAPGFEQYEIPVDVPATATHMAKRLQTRFIVASPAVTPNPPPPGGGPPPAPVRVLPPNLTPQVPVGHQVLLFLHGHVSSVEEALPVIAELHRAGIQRGMALSIISVDLPNCGYSESFDHTDVAATSATTFPSAPIDNEPITTPGLDFIEDFVVAFVDALDAITPFKDRFLGVFGGSLGGNLGLRLGRRSPMPAWLNKGIVSWNAASVWDPMVNDHVKSQAPGQALAKCDAAELDQSRRDYFTEVYDKPLKDVLLPFTQPQTWYRNDWEPCKATHISESRRARRETYSRRLRQWHFRVAGEQLIYSHVDTVVHRDNTTPVRCTLNTVRHLLIGSAEDNYTGSNIFDATRHVANLMSSTPGTSLFLLNTGHSVHFERPQYLAGQIVDFLAPPRPGVPSRWESLGGSITGGPAVSSWAARRLDLFARGPGDVLSHRWNTGAWSSWESLGGVLTSDPAAVSWGPNRIDVFARGQDNALWHRWYDNRWSGWESLGGSLTSGPAVSSWGNGRLDVFARGQDNALAHRWYDGNWSGWESLGGSLASGPAVSSWGNGRLDVFARGQDNALAHRWYDGNWSGWESLGGALSSDPAAVSWGPNRIDVFARGLNGGAWRTWYDGRWAQ